MTAEKQNKNAWSHILGETVARDTADPAPTVGLSGSFEGTILGYTTWVKGAFKNPDRLPIRVTFDHPTNVTNATIIGSFEGTHQQFILWTSELFRDTDILLVRVVVGRPVVVRRSRRRTSQRDGHPEGPARHVRAGSLDGDGSSDHGGRSRRPPDRRHQDAP
jgi:hypothetical protein